MPSEKFGHCYLGVDFSMPPHELPDIALADSQNIVPNESGLPEGRGGSVKLNSTSLGSRITSLHEFRSGSTRNQLCSHTTKIAYYNSGTGEFVTSITGLTTGKLLQWVNFAGKAIAVNEGSDVPQYWTDSSTYGDLAGSPPTGLTIADWSNRVWFGGDASQVARLTGSSVNDPTDYTGAAATATDAIQQTVGDSGDAITGLFGFFDWLLIGKRNNIYKLFSTTGNTTDATKLSIKPLYSKGSDNAGFTSPWAICQVGNDVIFQDGFDIKRVSGIQEFGDVEYSSIIPHFRDFLQETADKDYLQYTQFFHYKQKQQIWVSIPTGATTHFVFCLDYRFKKETGRYGFYPHSGITINCFAGIEDGEVDNMYFGDETGFVYQADTGNNDGGLPIDRFVTRVFGGRQGSGKYVSSGFPHRKQFANAETFINPSGTGVDVVPSYALNLLNYSDVRTSGNYTDLDTETIDNWTGTGVKRKRIPFFGTSGYSLAFKLRHYAVDENITLFPSELNYKWKKKNLID